MRTHGVLTIVLGLVVIALQPDVLDWAVVFLPVLTFSLWCSWRRLDRSLFNDGVTVLTACLMTVVAGGFGQRIPKPGTPGLAGLVWLPGADQGRIWVLAGLLLAYFAGTVLYVKTMIRDRADAGRYRLSVTYHVARVCARGDRKPVVGGAVCCLRGTGRRRAQEVAGADSSNGRRRRDRRESDPRQHAVARLAWGYRLITESRSTTGMLGAARARRNEIVHHDWLLGRDAPAPSYRVLRTQARLASTAGSSGSPVVPWLGALPMNHDRLCPDRAVRSQRPIDGFE